MNVDIRIPIGAMFFIIGVILTAFGAFTFSDTELYARSMNININLWWGFFLLAFGGIFLYLGLRGEKVVKKDN